jgi:outer membrane protein assembly factor BamB
VTRLWALVVLLATSPIAAAEPASDQQHNWPQWRGPQANGVAPHGDPPLTWDESTNIRWKVEIPGSGSSTPIVWGDRIFLLTAIDTGRKPEGAVTPAAAQSAAETPSPGNESKADAPSAAPRKPPNRGARGGGRRGGSGRGGRGGASLSVPTPTTLFQFDVICLDRATGQTLWQRTATEEVPHEGHHPSHGYASASPVTDGRRVFASFGSRGIYCYDFNGNLQWKHDFGQMETKRGFGEGASPALHGDALVVNWDHEGESFIVCLDANTGDERWRTPRSEGTTWTTPLVVEHKGAVQVIVNATGRTRSYDLATGELIWECGGQVDNPIPTPVARNGVVYCMTGYQGYAAIAISLDSKGDVTDTDKVLWRHTASAPYVGSPLLYDNRLYFTKGDAAILACLDADAGEPLYSPKRLQGLGTMYASPVAAAGRVYITDRDGATIVIEHGPKFKVLATNRLDEHFSASPVVVGNQLLLRGERRLYAIEPAQ